MAQTTTSKPINLYQLGQEMGNAALRMVGVGNSANPKTVSSTVAQDALDGAVNAHVANFSIVAPADVSAVNLATIQQRLQQALAANATFLASAKPGTAAAQASVAYDQTVRLTKECNALIRLALGQLDTITDTV